MNARPLDLVTGDWMQDPAVRSCGPAARGVWFDMLCLMWNSPRCGYLQHANGQPMTTEQIARATGTTVMEIAALLVELEEAGVFSRDEKGVIFNRRMVRDEVARQEGPPPKPAKKKKALVPVERPRDELFDAVSFVSGRDPKTCGAQIAVAVNKLKRAGYTPEDVREFGRRFWELCSWARADERERPTPTEISAHIGLLRAGPALLDRTQKPIRGRAGNEIDYASQTLLDALGDESCPTKPTPPSLEN